MHLRSAALLTCAALAAPATAAASVSSWQTCPVGPAGDTAFCKSGRSPQDLAVADGDVWVTTASEDLIRVSAAPATRGAMTFFAVPDFPGITKFHGTGGVARGPDGNLWIAEDNIPRAGRFTPAGVFSESPLTPYPALKIGGARDVVRGPDGAMWFTRAYGAMITRVTTAGVETDFPLPGTDSIGVALQSLVSGPGRKLWFIRSGQDAIGSITTSGAVEMFPTPKGIAFTSDLTAGPDGAIWFTARTNKSERGLVGRLAADGSFRIFDLGSYIPRAIHTDAGQLWIGSEIVAPAGHALIRMTTAGVVTRVEPLLFRPDISAITTGPDGAIWFADLSGAQVGRIDDGAAPAAAGPSPVEIDPSSLAVTPSAASVAISSSDDVTLDLRVAVDAPAVSGSAAERSRLRIAKRVRIRATRTVGKRSELRVAKGKRRVSVSLPASTRSALRNGAKLRIGLRATERTKRKTVVQATLRVR